MDRTLALLLNMIEDEFRGFAGVRVRLIQRSGTRRAPDLVQDYDPEMSRVHLRSGVSVQVGGGKEWFFPVNWYNEASGATLRRQITEIRQALGRAD